MKHAYGLLKDTKDSRDLIHRKRLLSLGLPRSVDLRPKMPPVFSQGSLGSCTANALVGMREYVAKITTEAKELSRLFLYWEERKIEDSIDDDAGAMIRDGMRVLNKLGVCPEEDYPYDIEKFKDVPSKKALHDALFYRISVYERVMDIGAARTALAAGHPVVFGFPVYESFESDDVAKTGIMPQPEQGEEILGGHAVLAVGYDNAKKWLIVRNSWGAEWGDKGYFYMPYSFFTKYFSDAWTATK